MPPQQAVVLAAVGQGREVGAQVALGIARAVLLTGELHPLPEDGQRQHLAAAQRGRGAGAVGLRGQVGLAEGVDQDIDCNQEGVHIHRVLLSWETDESYLPYGSGHLPVSRGHSMPRLTHTKRYSRTVYGARLSLQVGFLTSALTIVCGTLVGMIAGYYRRTEGVIMRITDGMMAFPGIILAIGIMAVRGPSVSNVVIALTIVSTPRVVRLVRSVVMGLRESPMVEAAIATGNPNSRVLWRHILPNI